MEEVTGVVGLDFSLTGTGIARVATDESVQETIEVVGTKAEKESGLIREERYLHILQAVNRIVQPMDLCFCEGYAHGAKFGREAAGELAGLMKFAIWRKTGRQVMPVSINSIKKWVTGKGGGKKDVVQLGAYKKYGREFQDDNACDAFCICDFGWHLANLPRGRELLKYEEQCIASYKKDNKEIANYLENLIAN